jgi:cobaltochelatase CobT
MSTWKLDDIVKVNPPQEGGSESGSGQPDSEIEQECIEEDSTEGESDGKDSSMESSSGSGDDSDSEGDEDSQDESSLSAESDDLSGTDESDDSSSDNLSSSSEESEEEVDRQDLLDALDKFSKNFEISDIDDLEEISKEVTDLANQKGSQSAGYRVANGVKDTFITTKGSDGTCKYLLSMGIKDLGSLSVRLRNLFTDRNSRRINGGLKKGRRISTRDAYRLYTDPAKGKSPRIWSNESDGKNQDAAVSLLVDNSGSMHGTKAELAERLTMALGTTLDRMRVPFEIIGYTGGGCVKNNTRQASVQFNISKTFEEKSFDIRRCVFPGKMDNTPDLDGLRLAAPRLLARPEPKKILFVFCDGQPNHDIRKYVKPYIEEIKKKGLVVFGFGMEADLSSFYGEDFIHVRHSEMSSFSKKVIEKLTKLLV